MKTLTLAAAAIALAITGAAAEPMPTTLVGQWCHVGDGAYVAAENFCSKKRDMVFIIHTVGFHVRFKDVKPMYLCVPMEVKVIDTPADTWPHGGGWRVIADCGANDNSGPVTRMGFTFTWIPNDGRMSITFGAVRR